MTDEQKNRLLVVETLSSVCWFLMDASWMFGLFTLAQVLAVLTIATALLVFRYAERTASDLLVTASVSCWACMNVCWMLNDSKLIGWGIHAGAVFFLGGAVTLAAAFFCAKSGRTVIERIIARFRRLRIGQ